MLTASTCGRCIAQLEQAVKVLDELGYINTQQEVQSIIDILRAQRRAALSELLGSEQN